MEENKLLKVKEKITKLLALGESESKLGNEGAAALIAEKVSALMAAFRLEESDFFKPHPEIEYKPLIGVSTIENPFLSKRPIEYRKPWSEFLASCIALGNLCKVTVNSRDGKLNFYGVDFNRDIAILMFEKIGQIALESCKNEMEKAKSMVGKKGFDIKTKKVVEYPKFWMGDDFFIDNFMFGFGNKLRENYLELIEQNSSLFDQIEETIASISGRQQIDAEIFSINLGADIDTQNIGCKYASFTSKKKAGKVQKAANIQISKRIDENKPGDNRVGEVWILLDRSGSMSWNNKIQEAKSGAIDFAKDAVSKQFAVGVIGFESRVEVNADLQLEINEEWIKRVNYLYATGGTSLFLAMKEAANKWKSYQRFKKVILIATDGEPTDATQEDILAYGNLLKASGIEIMTIGTQDADKDFLEKLSSGNKTLSVSDGELRKGLKGMAGLLSA